jgi:hypothetical protein
MSGCRPVATQRRPSKAISPRLQTRGADLASVSHEQRHASPGSASGFGSTRVTSVADTDALAAGVGAATRELEPHALVAAPERPESSASERRNFTR